MWIVRNVCEAGPLRYRFDAFQLDTDQYELRRKGEPVHVEPLVFDLLKLFAANAGMLIDRDRMIAEVWGGRIVSEATLSTAIKSARRSLGETGKSQCLIETVRSRGFRFTGAVATEVASAPAAPAECPATDGTSGAARDAGAAEGAPTMSSSGCRGCAG